jgi:hypothetical protein
MLVHSISSIFIIVLLFRVVDYATVENQWVPFHEAIIFFFVFAECADFCSFAYFADAVFAW